MARHIISIIIAAAAFALPAHAQIDSLRQEMTRQRDKYLNAADKAQRREAIAVMNDIDRRIRFANAQNVWENLDTLTAAGRDYRRIGITLRASGQEEYAVWCFCRGAELGEPYCVNMAFIDYLTKSQDPDAAIYFMSKLQSGMTPPLMHNMALAFNYSSMEQVRNLSKTLAEAYFTLMDNSEQEYGPYETNEYIDYFDNPTLRMFNQCWRKMDDRSSIGRTLRKILDE